MKIKFKMPALPPQVKGLLAPLKLAMEQALGRVMPYVMRLSPRERLIVAGGAVFVALFILIFGIITPLLHAGASLEKDIVSKDQQLKKIYIMSAGIKGFQSAAKTNPSTPGKQFTLFG
ncbi:MAG TPA: type II secretion system protein GspM, partial [Deltaproteobacteria bacterium]|nr:type II secretion system protein GspM [Deltaproteobacteria bacterium]